MVKEEMNTTIRKTVVTCVIGSLVACLFKIFSDISDNTYFSKQHTQELSKLQIRVERLEEENKKLSDIYVTRRELSIIVDSLKNTLISVDQKIDRVDRNLEKISDKL